MNLKKIKEFTKKELEQQLKNGIIDIDFLIEYTIKRDSVYNKLIDRVNFLDKKIQTTKGFIDAWKQEKYLKVTMLDLYYIEEILNKEDK